MDLSYFNEHFRLVKATIRWRQRGYAACLNLSVMDEAEPPHVMVDVAPYGAMELYAPETDTDLLLYVERNWAELWQSARTKLEARCRSDELTEHLKSSEWIAAVHRISADVYMGDKAQALLSLSLGETSPQWDFFLNGLTIVDFQPVY